VSKIKFYTEVPTRHLDELTPAIDGHFAIASECLKDPEYFNWYKNYDGRIILDNGMFEEGKPLDIDTLYYIADEIRPEVVFAPDQVGDSVKTIGMTEKFIHKCFTRNAPWKVGVIPQGPTPHDVVHCHNLMVEEFEFEGPVGISFLNSRREIVKIMNKEDAWDPTHDYHFLGLYDLDEIKTWPKCVTSMDTIKPFKAAYYGHDLEVCPRGLGKWNTEMNFHEGGLASERLLYRNYAKMHVALTRR